MMGRRILAQTYQYGRSDGLGIDNLVRVQIVLPDGRQVTASVTVESDIFGPLMNDLGIVSSFSGPAVKAPTETDITMVGLLLSTRNVFGGHCWYRRRFPVLPEPWRPRGSLSDFFRNCVFINCFVFAFYDDAKPGGSDPFSNFLAIPHQGRLANSNYTTVTLDWMSLLVRLLLYSHILADVATEVLSNAEDDDSTP
ncbi:hypothetical protein EDB85DRAFT_1895918 [Lactarius pseudohatsudake]|nr:hypothetical protein EDB85DRAFT_1895918 [Lactarius pseudohatsudake]